METTIYVGKERREEKKKERNNMETSIYKKGKEKET
jgi:hypothetical protein